MKKRVAITITDNETGKVTLYGSKVIETGPNGEITLPLMDIMKTELKRKKESKK